MELALASSRCIATIVTSALLPVAHLLATSNDFMDFHGSLQISDPCGEGRREAMLKGHAERTLDRVET